MQGLMLISPDRAGVVMTCLTVANASPSTAVSCSERTDASELTCSHPIDLNTMHAQHMLPAMLTHNTFTIQIKCDGDEMHRTNPIEQLYT